MASAEDSNDEVDNGAIDANYNNKDDDFVDKIISDEVGKSENNHFIFCSINN